MPSGAKKRKAAKKKKEIESTTSSNNNPQQQQQGENELKSIDEKGSDGDSPAYRKHGDDEFNEGSEEVEEIEVKPSAGVVEIEWDMKSEENNGGSNDDLVKAVTSVSEMQSGGGTVNDILEKSSLKVPETREFDGKLSSSLSQTPIPESTNGVKESNAAETSENQPPVAPLMVHKTSWLSCCGLFDVLSGSSR